MNRVRALLSASVMGPVLLGFVRGLIVVAIVIGLFYLFVAMTSFGVVTGPRPG